MLTSVPPLLAISRCFQIDARLQTKACAEPSITHCVDNYHTHIEESSLLMIRCRVFTSCDVTPLWAENNYVLDAEFHSDMDVVCAAGC